MIRPILRYGAEPLHRPAAPVAEITPDIQQLVDDMIKTMRESAEADTVAAVTA